jgi:ferredoxin
MNRRTFLYTGYGWLVGGLVIIASSGFASGQKTADPKKSEELYCILKVRCNGCKNCLRACKEKAISMIDGKAFISPDKCKGCGDCVSSCRRQAIKLNVPEKA